MTTDTAIEDSGLLLGEGWRDRIEAGVRGRIRGFIEEMLEAELLQALGRVLKVVNLDLGESQKMPRFIVILVFFDGLLQVRDSARVLALTKQSASAFTLGGTSRG